jgi:hypothetical protein
MQKTEMGPVQDRSSYGESIFPARGIALLHIHATGRWILVSARSDDFRLYAHCLILLGRPNKRSFLSPVLGTF